MNTSFFFMILAWIGSFVFLFWAICGWYFTATKTELEKALDRIQGYETVYPYGRNFILAVICIAYLITYYFGV